MEGLVECLVVRIQKVQPQPRACSNHVATIREFHQILFARIVDLNLTLVSFFNFATYNDEQLTEF